MKKFLSLILTAILLLTLVFGVYAEENTTKEYDIIQFGSYPQSKVIDENLIAELNSHAPDWENWTSYGYYTGNGFGSMEQGNWMRYTDVTYKGYRYRGVKFTQYRPGQTTSTHISGWTCPQYSNGYYLDIVYWFKFEPIEWMVLDYASGLVLCKTVIDSQAYSNTIYMKGDLATWNSFYNDAVYSNFATDYETSSIRKWLNEVFYNTAFTYVEKEKINTTLLRNDAYYTSVGIGGYQELDSNLTSDKVFLLSYNESIDTKYGFSKYSSDHDLARVTKGSDYAKCQGLKVYLAAGERHGDAYWTLRTGGTNSGDCLGVFYEGSSDYPVGVADTSFGIRPAMVINGLTISSCEHKNTNHCPYITPDCIEKGYTEGLYCNDCLLWLWGHHEIPENGHSYYVDTIVAATHLQKGKTIYICYTCKDTKYVFIDKIPNHTYLVALTPPTCTTYGFTVYTCECGDSYIDDYVDKLKHKDDNFDYFCDYGCGHDFEQPAPEVPDEPEIPDEPTTPDQPEEELSLIQKIINWFKNLIDKLFGWLKF